jgi:hypothetical protein
VLENHQGQQLGRQTVSVAGCLGYDVLAIQAFRNPGDLDVSVAGCLGSLRHHFLQHIIT